MDISFNQVGGVSTLCFLELVRGCNMYYSFQFEFFISNTYLATWINNTSKLDPWPECVFLFQVNKEVGKDHLFKRSIILIKAWCYHEGNIHGSNHWLMSTYALEVLILNIFNLFHTSIHGPLQVIPRKTIQVTSQYVQIKVFWLYLICLTGPVQVSAVLQQVWLGQPVPYFSWPCPPAQRHRWVILVYHFALLCYVNHLACNHLCN